MHMLQILTDHYIQGPYVTALAGNMINLIQLTHMDPFIRIIQRLNAGPPRLILLADSGVCPPQV